MRLFLVIFYLLLIVVGVSFAVLNADSVWVNFYLTRIKLPVSLLITLSLGLGILIGSVMFIFKYWRLRLDYHHVKNQLKMTEKEIKNLRSIPLHDQH